MVVALVVIGLLCVGAFFVGERDDREERATGTEEEQPETFDAFAGGYPVPPMSSAHLQPRDQAPPSVMSSAAAGSPSDARAVSTGKRED
jgi:NADH-quinone oxidoreductase subunit H